MVIVHDMGNKGATEFCIYQLYNNMLVLSFQIQDDLSLYYIMAAAYGKIWI